MDTGGFSTGETPSPQKLNWSNSISWRDLFSSGHGRNSEKSETFQQGVDNQMGWAKPIWNLVDS